MATKDITAEEFNTTINDNEIVLVDFWASWCGPCRAFAPTFAASSEKHPDVVYAKVDTEAEQQLAAAADIRSIPTLMAFKKGKLVFNQAGALPPAALEDLIQQVKEFDIDAAIAAEGDSDRADAAARDSVQSVSARRPEFVLVDRPRPHVALVTLNRPERMNSMAFDVMVPLKGGARGAHPRQLRAGGRAHRRGPRLLLGRRPQVRGLRPARRRADPADVRAAVDGGARRRHPRRCARCTSR